MKAKKKLKLRFTRENETKANTRQIADMICSALHLIYEESSPDVEEKVAEMGVTREQLAAMAITQMLDQQGSLSVSSQEERQRPQGLAIPHVPDDLLPAVRALVRTAALLGNYLATIGQGSTLKALARDSEDLDALRAASLTIKVWCQSLGIDETTLEDIN